MLFSCKISNSILTYLEQQGEDITPLLECTSLPEEFLRDPSYWMKSPEMEFFLQSALHVSHSPVTENLLQKVGHLSPELRSWGVLDSVLRMMPRPQEILAQPVRFLSYFVSPEPPIDNLSRTENSISFDLPVSADQYPLVTTYLRSAFESLPMYTGQSMASCSWDGINLRLNWSSEQSSILNSQQLEQRQISPELMQSVMESLEKHQKELEEKNRELQEKNEQLLKAQREMEEQLSNNPRLDTVLKNPLKDFEFINESSIQVLFHNLSCLGDYMVRAQQLVTLLVAQDRMNPAVKAAMKKVDWERIKSQFPETIQECREVLEKTKNQYKESPRV